MRRVRRYFRKGDTVFLTNVTYNRHPILTRNSDLIWESIKKQQSANAFELIAWVIMPDHIHLMIDPLDNNVGDLMKRFKLSFASSYRQRFGISSGRVWQNRYWDHIIRDQNDLNKHLDYVHYNPVKHSVAIDPGEYSHSSFQSFLIKGNYEKGWGKPGIEFRSKDFGE